MALVAQSPRLDGMPRVKRSSTTNSSLSTEGFEAGARSTLGALRAAVCRLLGDSEYDLSRPTDVKKVLGVGVSPAWQIFKITATNDPLDTVAYIPRPEAMGKLMAAFDQAGFDKTNIRSVEETYSQFIDFVDHHAGDRSSFDAMIAAINGGGAGEQDLRDRRAVFRGNANIWGVQTRIFYRGIIIQHPENNADMKAAVSVSGCLGLRALRPVPPIPIVGRLVVVKDEGRTIQHEQPDRPVMLLADFCSHPLPQIETHDIGGVFHKKMVQIGGIGRTAGIDCFVQDQSEAIPRLPEYGYTAATFIHSPCEYLIFDMLLPVGWSDPITAQSRTYGDVSFTDRAVSRSHELLMPVKETLQHVGTAIDALYDRLMPRAPELVRHVLKARGWQNTEFDIYRCVVRYPILHSNVTISVQSFTPSDDHVAGESADHQS